MRIDTGQHMRLGQQMKLAPRMIQSMEILQMASLELLERIEQELASNPTLELREADPDTRANEMLREQNQRDAAEGEREINPTSDATNTDDFERLANFTEEHTDGYESTHFETGEPYRPARNTGERDAKLDAMANTGARNPSLEEQLLNQWHLVEAPPAVMAAGEHLIGFIDDDGYLRTPRAELVAHMPRNVASSDLDAALPLLQQCLDPAGLAARNLRECLLLQIDARIKEAARENALLPAPAPTDWSAERLIVSDYLKEVEANRLPDIAKSSGLPIEAVQRALRNLRFLTPHPGRLLVDAPSRTITPDATIEYDEELDRYVARLRDDRLPALTINRQYARMAKDRTVDRKTRDFVGNNMRSARWLLDAIEQRNNTLLRVINVVLEAQRDYLDLGPAYLKPLPMTLVADQLGIHVATVSRAVSEKYLQTSRGIVPLRMFFSGGTETDEGDAMSWTAVQAKLEQVIAEEDKSNPLNDDELVEKLKEIGIVIARRTVAKYRKQLKIPPARQRREYT